MKIDFANLNIEPQPNPKPLRVRRVSVSITNEEGREIGGGDAFITNCSVVPRRAVMGLGYNSMLSFARMFRERR